MSGIHALACPARKSEMTLVSRGVYSAIALSFFFGPCCARHNDSGSHEDMLKWSSVDNSIEQVGQ